MWFGVSKTSRRYGRRALARKALVGFGLLPLAARAQGAELRLLMLGDSITAGFGLARGEAPPARLEALLR